MGRIPAFRPGQQSSRYPNAPVGLVYPGDSGVGDGGTRNTYNNFSPRISIAWQPKALPNTSIRAAFGIFIAPLSMSTYNHAGDVAPFAPTYPIDPGTIGDRPIPFEDPWSVYAPTGGVSASPTFRNGRVRSTPKRSLLYPACDVGGKFPRGLQVGKEPDLESLGRASVLFEYPLQGCLRGEPDLRPRQPAPAQSWHLSQSLQRLKYPEFRQHPSIRAVGTASYNAMQLTFEKRFSSGLQFTSNYSWSKEP